MSAFLFHSKPRTSQMLVQTFSDHQLYSSSVMLNISLINARKRQHVLSLPSNVSSMSEALFHRQQKTWDEEQSHCAIKRGERARGERARHQLWLQRLEHPSSRNPPETGTTSEQLQSTGQILGDQSQAPMHDLTHWITLVILLLFDTYLLKAKHASGNGCRMSSHWLYTILLLSLSPFSQTINTCHIQSTQQYLLHVFYWVQPGTTVI